MQDDSGLKRILSDSLVYERFQDFVGAKSVRKWLAVNYWRLQGGEKVVDIGCGPGVVLDYLPGTVRYVGFDISKPYIESARRRYGQRGTFLVGTAEEFVSAPDDRMKGADVVLCNGLLHHLDDVETLHVLELAKQILLPTGRLVCFEPVFLAHQGYFSKWVMSRDRGRNVRTEQGWKNLVGRVFSRFSTSILTGLAKIPYIYIVIECQTKADENGQAQG